MAFLTTIAGGRRGRPALRRRLTWLVGLVLLRLAVLAASAQAAVLPEYQLKAVFLFNFAQFVEWPARAFRDAEAPLVIGVLGDDPFGAYLDDLVKGEKVGTRPLLVRRFKRPQDITDCHILFISRSETGALAEIIAQLKGRSLLSVSDADPFTRLGGMVRFVTDSGKLRLRINVAAARACDLTISSKILRPATLVTADND